jgi:ribosomal protein S24E
MADAQVTLRTRKFIRNPLLGRKQMVVCVFPDAQFPPRAKNENENTARTATNTSSLRQ